MAILDYYLALDPRIMWC